MSSRISAVFSLGISEVGITLLSGMLFIHSGVVVAARSGLFGSPGSENDRKSLLRRLVTARRDAAQFTPMLVLQLLLVPLASPTAFVGWSCLVAVVSRLYSTGILFFRRSVDDQSTMRRLAGAGTVLSGLALASSIMYLLPVYVRQVPTQYVVLESSFLANSLLVFLLGGWMLLLKTTELFGKLDERDPCSLLHKAQRAHETHSYYATTMQLLAWYVAVVSNNSAITDDLAAATPLSWLAVSALAVGTTARIVHSAALLSATDLSKEKEPAVVRKIASVLTSLCGSVLWLLVAVVSFLQPGGSGTALGPDPTVAAVVLLTVAIHGAHVFVLGPIVSYHRLRPAATRASAMALTASFSVSEVAAMSPLRLRKPPLESYDYEDCELASGELRTLLGEDIHSPLYRAKRAFEESAVHSPLWIVLTYAVLTLPVGRQRYALTTTLFVVGAVGQAATTLGVALNHNLRHPSVLEKVGGCLSVLSGVILTAYFWFGAPDPAVTLFP